MTIPDHEYVGDWAEKERVERFIAWFRNDVDALWGGGIPDWQYEYEGEDWYIEITSASTRPREHGAAYRRRLADDPTSATVPSSSGLTDRGIPFETTEANESELRRAIAEAVRRKGPNIKRYGHPSRTHLLIDASGDTVTDEAAAHRLAAAVPVPDDYPYAGVFVMFAIRGWERIFVQLRFR